MQRSSEGVNGDFYDYNSGSFTRLQRIKQWDVYQTDRQVAKNNRQTDRQTERQTDREQTGNRQSRQTYERDRPGTDWKQTDRQTDREKDGQKQKDSQTQRQTVDIHKARKAASLKIFDCF